MGTTEDQLRKQAEADRARMGETLEAIGDRLSPDRMMERRKAAVKYRFRRIRESVMGSPGYDEPATQRVRERASGLADSASASGARCIRSAAPRAASPAESAKSDARSRTRCVAGSS